MERKVMRKWNFNFRGESLSAAWIRWEPIASFSLLLTEERLLWKLTQQETGWHSSNIRCIHENLGFWIARCGFGFLCCRSRMAGTGSSIPCPWNVDSRFQSLPRFRASYIEQAPAVKNVDNAIHRINLYPVDSHSTSHSGVVQNRRAGEQKSHWDKTNKENYNLELCMSFVCLVPVRLLLSSVQFCTTWMASCKGPIGFPNTYPLAITVHLGYPLLTVFCSVALEIKAGNRTWYLGCLDSFLWKCYPRKRIHCTCHLVTLNIFHWVKNLRCHLCFFPVRILDGCHFL